MNVQYKAMAGRGELLATTFDGIGGSGVATVRAVVATLGKIDGDNDLTLPGYFGRQDVQVVPAHDWNHTPLGKGVLYEQGDQAIADLKINLAIPAARSWEEALKFGLEHPPSLQQWSYGFRILPGGSWEGKFQGRPVRFLQPLADGSPGVDVIEVSPVMRGAGVATSTLEVADAADVDQDPDLAREYARFVASTMEAA